MTKPHSPELVIDLHLPASLPSRYRGKLVSVTRLEARLRFLFEPAVFRTGEVETCAAEIVLVVGRQSVRLRGDLEPEAGSPLARLVFEEPIALPDYSFLRKGCGLEEAAEAAETDDAPSRPEAVPLLAARGS